MGGWHISRRTALKGLGVAIGLPVLEAMMPALSYAVPPARRTFPKRLAFVYVPNGIHMPDWTPSGTGALPETLPEILRPLNPFRDETLVLSGLTLDKARPNGDGPGDHARAMSAFLTGCQPRKTAGADIRAGISADQHVARHIGDATRFASLEIGCEGGRLAGNCDSGYSCAYSSNLSWRAEATPNPKEVNPRAVFDRLFGTANRGPLSEFDQSILDFVRDDAQQLRGRLGSADLRRLDEYLTSIREVERRIQRADRSIPANAGGMNRPHGTPSDYRDHIRLMSDLLALAFQTDLTRVATFVYANEGSNRSYRLIDVAEGHHDLSHHGNDAQKQNKIKRINTFHIEQFAYLLRKLKDVREGDGTLLDHCMIVYGSGNGDGNRHNHDDLPILLAGKGGGALSPGRHLRYHRNTPLMNLYLALFQRMGCPAERFGDSTGALGRLA